MPSSCIRASWQCTMGTWRPSRFSRACSCRNRLPSPWSRMSVRQVGHGSGAAQCRWLPRMTAAEHSPQKLCPHLLQRKDSLSVVQDWSGFVRQMGQAASSLPPPSAGAHGRGAHPWMRPGSAAFWRTAAALHSALCLPFFQSLDWHALPQYCGSSHRRQVLVALLGRILPQAVHWTHCGSAPPISGPSSAPELSGWVRLWPAAAIFRLSLFVREQPVRVLRVRARRHPLSLKGGRGLTCACVRVCGTYVSMREHACEHAWVLCLRLSLARGDGAGRQCRAGQCTTLNILVQIN